MKQYLKSSLLIVVVGFSMVLHLQAANSSTQARKRVERVMGHVQPDAGVKKEEVASDASVQKAQKRLQRLKKQVQPSTPKQALTPEGVAATEMFLQEPDYCPQIKEKWFPELVKHGDAIKKMLENEKRYEDTYFVFYHAQQTENRLVVEFLRNLYEFETKKKLRPDFEFLRLWKDGSDYKDVNSYLDSFGIPNPFTVGVGNLNDNRADIRGLLLAVNPVLFGNFNYSGECTFQYFLANRSIANFIREALGAIFSQYKFEENLAHKLIDINKNFPAKTGDIIQIFIPKHLVNTYAYLCRAWGAPKKSYFVDGNDQPIVQIKKDDQDDEGDYDPVRERYVKCDKILELLQTQKGVIKNSQDIQLRLFFAKSGPLLNPDMGAKMFRFTALTPQQLQEYKQRVAAASREIFAHTHSGARFYAKTVYRADPMQSPRGLNLKEKGEVEQAFGVLTTPVNLLQAMDASDSLPIMKELLAKGADINIQNKDGATPLMLAAQQGKLDIVQFLVDASANKDAQDKKGKTALMLAAYSRQLEVVQFLVAAGVDKDAHDANGETALMYALKELRHLSYPDMIDARNKQLDLIRFLVTAGVDLAARDQHGRTAFLYAAGSRDLEAVQLLINAGADKEVRDAGGQTALMHAVAENSLEIVRFLVHIGLDKDAYDVQGRTALISAANYGYLDIVQFLVGVGANKDAYDKDGQSSLMLVAHYGRLDTVRFLLQAGVDKNAQDKKGKTALMLAADYNWLEIVQILVEAGADVDIEDADGKTALQIAEDGGPSSKQIVEYLQAKRTDPFVIIDRPNAVEVLKQLSKEEIVSYKKDKHGRTILMYAVEKGKSDVVQFLVQAGVDVNETDTKGRTALMFAAQYGKLDVAKFLVQSGATVDAKRVDGKTALQIAQDVGKRAEGVAQYLQNFILLTDLFAVIAHPDAMDLLNKFSKERIVTYGTNKDGLTPLMYAVEQDKIRVVEYLVGAGVDLDAKNSDGKTAEQMAESTSRSRIAHYLQEYKKLTTDVFAAIDDYHPMTWLRKYSKEVLVSYPKNKKGQTPLIYAVEKDGYEQQKVVQFLVGAGVDINDRDAEGMTALMRAARMARAEIAGYLINAGADKEVRSEKYEWTALICALARLRELIGSMKDDRGDRYKDQMVATIEKQANLVRLLVNSGANKEARDSYDETALMYAVSSGDLGIVQFLIDAGANKDVRNKYDRTLLMFAARAGYLDIVQFLVQGGADLDAKDKADRTALDLAKEEKRDAVVEYLQEQKKQLSSNIFAVIDHSDAMTWLARFPKKEIVPKFPFVREKDSQTPLMYAVEKGKFDVVRFLVEAGVNLNAKDDNGKTAWQIAKDKGYTDIAQYLQQKYKEQMPGYKKVIKKIKSKL
ncbi:MAG TPA: ankyrin repeat domain-containing protein [Candidatus Babeliales bacterium]|nr:ankyrin repeat domain-containing protein [Candidatus Babeliales bacterium]